MNELNQNPVQVFTPIDILFGDLPLDYWADMKNDEQPWNLFKELAIARDNDNNAGAIETLKKIIDLPNLESRQYLQAYYSLHNLQGFMEDEIKLFGVIVEVGMPQGNDTLAVYADYSARYYNYSGSAIIWEHGDVSLNGLIDRILTGSMEIVSGIGPWKEQRPKPPAEGMARINFLTSHGLHFGQANQQALFNDPVAGKIMYDMLEVMQQLIDYTSRQPE
jgi:hypothetical protein